MLKTKIILKFHIKIPLKITTQNHGCNFFISYYQYMIIKYYQLNLSFHNRKYDYSNFFGKVENIIILLKMGKNRQNSYLLGGI